MAGKLQLDRTNLRQNRRESLSNHLDRGRYLWNSFDDGIPYLISGGEEIIGVCRHLDPIWWRMFRMALIVFPNRMND